MMSRQYEHFDTRRLNEIPITTVAQRLGCQLRRSGSLQLTNCLWHADEHPSLALYHRTGENHCYCYVCKASKSVIDFVMQKAQCDFKDACRWLSNEFGIGTTPAPAYLPRRQAVPLAEQEKPVVYIPMEMLEGIESADSSLCKCLKRLYRPEAVEWVAEEYRLGIYKIGGHEDCTVFPSIDYQGRVCNLKVQHYDSNPQSPRFGHSQKGLCYWLGSMWQSQHLLPENGRLRSDCLFGEHLIDRYPRSTVALVESPKNALFGALSMPQLLWVATGNKVNLKPEVLERLRGSDVLIIPDADAVDDWLKETAKMADLANFAVSDFCRRTAPEGMTKFDIADYFQRERLDAINSLKGAKSNT